MVKYGQIRDRLVTKYITENAQMLKQDNIK